jgi:5-methylcytosine-specific restriction endonuclease McrBC GTP-binding regulatory subunit McrB
VKNGFFVEACVQAVENPDTAVVVVLDELNRCNIPKVLGDLMTVIEESKRAVWSDVDEVWQVDGTAKAVTLPYSGRKLFVPDNLFIVGTMNTTDRSVAPMDAALRRRFSFHRIWPDGFLASNSSPALSDLAEKLREPAIAPHTELWLALNRVLCAKFGADAMLGHSYLYDLRTALARDSKLAPHHWDHRILPQLMDVIESNGLTRLLVKDEAKFFDREKALPGRDLITKHIQVTFSGEGSLKKPHLKYLGSTNP